MPRLRKDFIKKSKSKKNLRIDFICNMLLQNRFKDGVILRKATIEFMSLQPLSLERIAKLRSKLNRGKVSGFTSPEIRIEKITK